MAELLVLFIAIGCPAVSFILASRLAKRGLNPLICICGSFAVGTLLAFGLLFAGGDTLGPLALGFPAFLLLIGAGSLIGTKDGAPDSILW
jgi:hypothetical protein